MEELQEQIAELRGVDAESLFGSRVDVDAIFDPASKAPASDES
jgi:hypothetical protein